MQNVPAPILPPEAIPGSSGKPSASFEVLASLAAKALSMNRVEEAQRILSTPLDNILTAAQQGSPPDEQTLLRAVECATKLATAGGGSEWIDYGFNLYASVERLMPAATIEQLYEAVSKARHTNSAALRAYLDTLNSRRSSYNPNERFLLERLQGLRRRVSG